MAGHEQALIAQTVDWESLFNIPLYNGDGWRDSIAFLRSGDLLDHPRSPLAEDDLFGLVVVDPKSDLANLLRDAARQPKSYHIIVTFQWDGVSRMDLLVALDTWSRDDETLKKYGIPFDELGRTAEEISQRPTLYEAFRVDAHELDPDMFIALAQPLQIVGRTETYPDYMTYLETFHGL